MLISRSQDKLDDVARGLGKCVWRVSRRRQKVFTLYSKVATIDCVLSPLVGWLQSVCALTAGGERENVPSL